MVDRLRSSGVNRNAGRVEEAGGAEVDRCGVRKAFAHNSVLSVNWVSVDLFAVRHEIKSCVHGVVCLLGGGEGGGKGKPHAH